MTDKNNKKSAPSAEAFQAVPDLIVKQLEATAVEHYKNEHLPRAQDFLEQLVKMRPDSVDYWTLLGVVHRRQKNRAAALQALQKAVQLDGTDKNALVNLGETLCEAGKLKEGVDLLRAVFEMGHDPAKPPAEQDYYTKRAGAELAVIQKVARDVIAAHKAQQS